MELNKIPLTHIAATLAKAMEITPPKNTEGEINELNDYIKKQTKGEKIEKVLIYNPDAIGQWIYEKYIEKFINISKYAPYKQPMLSVIPPKTPVCFASIYSGASPEVHGIQRYTKPVVKTDTLFDSMIRAGKKPCIVSVAGQSMDKIFKEREMAYFSTKDDAEAVDVAVELIKNNEYDFIAVYNQEYDSAMHITHPQSKRALNALDHYAEAFVRLGEAIKQYWNNYDSLIAMITDHGVHRMWNGLGMHGKNIAKDMNIMHFYGVINKIIK